MTDKVDVIWSNHGLGTQGSAGHGNSLPCAKKDGSKPVHGPTIVDSLPFLCIFLFSLWQCKYHQSTQWQPKRVPCGIMSFCMETNLCSNYPVSLEGAEILHFMIWGNGWTTHCNMMKPKLEQFMKQTLRILIGLGEMVSGINSTVTFDQQWDNGGKHLPWWWLPVRGTRSWAQATTKPDHIYPNVWATWTEYIQIWNIPI